MSPGLEYRKLAFLLLAILLPVALLVVVFDVSLQNDNQLYIDNKLSVLSFKPHWYSSFFSHPPRHVLQPGSTILSAAFLHGESANITEQASDKLFLDSSHGHGVVTGLRYLFLQLGTYRTSARAFSTAGSISRSLEDWLHPQFACEWVPIAGTAAAKSYRAQKFRPGENFPGVYDALVVICHFDQDIGSDGRGGKLFISYWHQDKSPERFLALTESPGDYNATTPLEFDIMYCGSPIYGHVSPQRVREWLAYHAYVLGDRSHFVLYDAGGLSRDAVMQILRPWVKLGRVSVQNIRRMEMFHGYYHHQHTVLNDCLLQSQLRANWTFFFDVDEYLYVDPVKNISNLLAEKAGQGVTTIRFDQKPMSTSLCSLQEPPVDNSKLWGFEKYVFTMHWKGEPQAQKYAVQARFIDAVEVHDVFHAKWGKHQKVGYDHIWFHHFHGFITHHSEGCRDFTNTTLATWEEPFTYWNEKYSADLTLARLGKDIRQFEITSVGKLPFIL